MCRPASFVLTKDRVFWSKRSDSHNDIISEYGLVSGVRVRIYPENRDLASDPAGWRFAWAQATLPQWAVKDECDARARTALSDWIAAKIVQHDTEREIRDQEVYVYDSGRVVAYGSSIVYAYGFSEVSAYDSTRVIAYDASVVTLFNSSRVTANDSSKVTAYDSATVIAYNHYSTVRPYLSESPLNNAVAIELRRKNDGR